MSRTRSFLLLFAVCLSAIFAGAQPTPATQVRDASVLRPPTGARVAIFEFSDMECPSCALQNPLIKSAAAQYKVPWLRHDFPLPYHPWSMQASINARWFDTKSKALGDGYRDYIFENQKRIATMDNLRSYTDSYARSHGLAIPFSIDPQGKLAAAVKADQALGSRVGITHTPTVWIVYTLPNGAPAYREVQDFSQLYQILDYAIAASGANHSAARPKTGHK